MLPPEVWAKLIQMLPPEVGIANTNVTTRTMKRVCNKPFTLLKTQKVLECGKFFTLKKPETVNRKKVHFKTTSAWSGTHYSSLCNFYYFFSAYRVLQFLIHYLYSITVRSAAPQTSLWGGPRPRFEPGKGDLEAGTLTARPPLLLCIFFFSVPSTCHLVFAIFFYQCTFYRQVFATFFISALSIT